MSFNPEYLAIGAGAFFVLCFAYAFWPKGKAAIQQIAAPLKSSVPPMRAAFDQIEDQARTSAAERIAADVAEHYASQHKAAIQAAIGPKGPSSTPLV